MCGIDETEKWLPRKICGQGVTNPGLPLTDLWPQCDQSVTTLKDLRPRCDQDVTILTDLWPRCDQDWPTERFVSNIGPIWDHPDIFLAKVWPICDHPKRFVAEMWPPWQFCGQGGTNMRQIFSRDKTDTAHNWKSQTFLCCTQTWFDTALRHAACVCQQFAAVCVCLQCAAVCLST